MSKFTIFIVAFALVSQVTSMAIDPVQIEYYDVSNKVEQWDIRFSDGFIQVDDRRLSYDDFKPGRITSHAKALNPMPILFTLDIQEEGMWGNRILPYLTEANKSKIPYSVSIKKENTVSISLSSNASKEATEIEIKEGKCTMRGSALSPEQVVALLLEASGDYKLYLNASYLNDRRHSDVIFSVFQRLNGQVKANFSCYLK